MKWFALGVLAVLLFATTIPGVFIIDDGNYLINIAAVRGGHVSVANTAGLTPSPELVAFDPGARGRSVSSTPVASTAPPLYGPVALPFSVFGLRGLIALNILAYLATIVLVFAYANRYASRTTTAWLAAAAFALGGFALEYAHGIWPQALSLALCTAAIVAIARAIDGGPARVAALAGFLLALATGVRYQNAVVLAVGAGALALWSRPRWSMLAAYAMAASIPLASSAAINHARFGSWNPISKGAGYLNVPMLNESAGSAFDPLTMLWARVVDFTARPPLVGPLFVWVRYDTGTGAHLMLGDVAQKAFLQSAPWAILGFIVFGLAWVRRVPLPDAQRRQLRFLSLPIAGVVATFAFSEVHRHEGLAFNQRYLLELLPLAAVGFAWALDGIAFRRQPFIAGVVWGMLPAAVFLFGMAPGTLRILALLKFPLLIAAALAALWFLARSRARLQPLLLAVAGAAIGWGLALHVGDDAFASRGVRGWNAQLTAGLRKAVPDRSALLTYWGAKDAAIPLVLDRDLVVLDAHADDGRDAPVLIGELLASGRRVFVLRPGFPEDLLARITTGWAIVPRPGTGLMELRPRSR